MSITYTKGWGYIDSNPITTDPLSVDLYKLAYATDFAPRVPSDRERKAEGNKTGLNFYVGNVTSPTDQPENFRFGLYDVPNVYAGRPEVDPVLFSPQKRGKKILWVTENILRVINDSTGEVIDLPFSATTTLTFALSPFVTETELFAFYKRHASLGFDTTDTSGRIGQLARGQLWAV